MLSRLPASQESQIRRDICSIIKNTQFVMEEIDKINLTIAEEKALGDLFGDTNKDKLNRFTKTELNILHNVLSPFKSNPDKIPLFRNNVTDEKFHGLLESTVADIKSSLIRNPFIYPDIQECTDFVSYLQLVKEKGIWKNTVNQESYSDIAGFYSRSFNELPAPLYLHKMLLREVKKLFQEKKDLVDALVQLHSQKQSLKQKLEQGIELNSEENKTLEDIKQKKETLEKHIKQKLAEFIPNLLSLIKDELFEEPNYKIKKKLADLFPAISIELKNEHNLDYDNEKLKVCLISAFTTLIAEMLPPICHEEFYRKMDVDTQILSVENQIYSPIDHITYSAEKPMSIVMFTADMLNNYSRQISACNSVKDALEIANKIEQQPSEKQEKKTNTSSFTAAGGFLGAGLGGGLGFLVGGGFIISTFAVGTVALPFFVMAGGFIGGMVGMGIGKGVDKIMSYYQSTPATETLKLSDLEVVEEKPKPLSTPPEPQPEQTPAPQPSKPSQSSQRIEVIGESPQLSRESLSEPKSRKPNSFTSIVKNLGGLNCFTFENKGDETNTQRADKKRRSFTNEEIISSSVEKKRKTEKEIDTATNRPSF